MSLRMPLTVAAAACLALAAAGCGDSTSDSGASGASTPSTAAATTAPATTTAASGPTALTVTMSDFAFTPKDVTAPAGELSISAPNEGKAPHELVLIKTDTDPAKLPTKANGEADEDAFPASALPGEIGETEAGKTGTITVTLPAGKYVMLCNVPGHYKAGMYGTLTVQ